MLISCGLEEVCAFCGVVSIEELADAADEGVDGSGRVVSGQGFQLGERHLDGVQVRAVEPAPAQAGGGR